MKFHLFFLLFASLFLISCDGIICEGKNSEGKNTTVVFHYDPLFKTVDVGGAPTYVKNSSWVKKLIVEEEGFIVVTEVKTAGFEKVPCDNNPEQLCDKHKIRTYYNMQSYKESEGYKYWFDIPKKEWSFLSQLEDQATKPPSFHIKNCRASSSAPLLETFLAVFRI